MPVDAKMRLFFLFLAAATQAGCGKTADCREETKACATGFKCDNAASGAWECVKATEAAAPVVRAGAAAPAKETAQQDQNVAATANQPEAAPAPSEAPPTQPVAPPTGTPSWAVAPAAVAPQAVAPAAKNSMAYDAQGEAWLLHGHYEAEFTSADFDHEAHTAAFVAGNGCGLEGTVTGVRGEPKYRFTATQADGEACPRVGGPAATFEIEVLDGPGLGAFHNAQNIKVIHKQPSGELVNFSGKYSFEMQ